MTKVQSMISNNGNKVANQFTMQDDKGRYFQSYNSVIAFIDHDVNVTLDNSTWDYSVTTGKYRNQFLGEGIADTRAKIKSGVYKLDNLN